MDIDFGRTASDYATHRAGFPDSLFDRLAHHGVGRAGQRVVDLGTGTGSLARGFAARGCHVIGVDPSADMLDHARRLAARAGLSIETRVAKAERTGLATCSADVVAAGQCWHWFDRPAAATECRRLLRPGGALAICHFDWLPLPGSVAEATESLVLAHNPGWQGAGGGGGGTYPEWVGDVEAAGFVETVTFCYDEPVTYSHDAWRGRVRACAGVGASLGADEVERFDAEHAAMLATGFPDDRLVVEHRVWALVARSPAERT